MPSKPLNERWRKIFASYFLNKIREYESKKALMENCIDENDYTYRLIMELTKPFFSDKPNLFNRRKSIMRRNSNNSGNNKSNDPKRDLNICYSILLKIQGFKEFCIINSINNDCIFNVIPYMSVQMFPKNTHIFECGEPSKYFYCILNGKVSIRIPVDEIKKNVNKKKINTLFHKDTPNFKTYEDNTSMFNEKFNLNTLATIESVSPPPKKKAKITKLSVYEYSNSVQPSLCKEMPGILSPYNNKRDQLPPNVKNFLASNNNNSSINLKKINFNNSVNFKMINSQNYNQFLLLNNLQNLQEEEEEVEQFTLDKGKCFGDWGIIYNQNRCASAVAVEDYTYCAMIMKDIFDDNFGKFILKAETDRRNFFREKLQIFKDVAKFEDYYKRIVIMVANSNQVIYLEGEKGNTVYLIYQGESFLEKNIFTKSKHNSDIHSLSRKSNCVMKLVSGAFAGMEVFCFPDSKYRYTLRTISPVNIIYKITLEDLPEYKNELKSFMAVLYEKQNMIISKLLKQKNHIKKSYDQIFKTKLIELKQLPIEDSTELGNSKEKSCMIPSSDKIKNTTYEDNYNYDTGAENSNEDSNLLFGRNSKKHKANSNNFNKNNKNNKSKSSLRQSTLLLEENPNNESPNKFYPLLSLTKSNLNETNKRNDRINNDLFVTKNPSMSFKTNSTLNENLEEKLGANISKNRQNNIEFKYNEKLLSSDEYRNKFNITANNSNNIYKSTTNFSETLGDETLYLGSGRNVRSDFSNYTSFSNNMNKSNFNYLISFQDPNKKVLANKLVYSCAVLPTYKMSDSLTNKTKEELNATYRASNNNLNFINSNENALIQQNQKRSVFDNAQRMISSNKNLNNKTYQRSTSENCNNKDIHYKFPKIEKNTVRIEGKSSNKYNKNENEINLISNSNVQRKIAADSKREKIVLKTPLKRCVINWKNFKETKDNKDNKKNLFYRTSYFNLPLISNLNDE